jgi:hypothetical protein
MIITFTARKSDLTDYNKFWIEVTKHNPDGDVTRLYGEDQPDGELTEGNRTWAVEFRDIYAKEMGIDVSARLYAQNAAGEIHMSPLCTKNIRDYLAEILTTEGKKDAWYVLCADMLNYGAAAQVYKDFQTDHLVNQELSANALAKLHQYETTELPVVAKTNVNTKPEGEEECLYTSVGLDNEVKLVLTVRKDAGTQGVQVQVKNHATGAVVTTLDTTWMGRTFQASFSGIGAAAMRTEFDFVTLVNGVETGNIYTWSVEAYVGEIRSDSNQAKVNVANALLTYGDAAAGYFAAQNGQ